MTTKLSSRVNREVRLEDKHGELDLIVSLTPTGVELRTKGTRKSVGIPYRELLLVAARYERTGNIGGA